MNPASPVFGASGRKIDPDSPYCKDVFGSGKEFVFYCAAAWRSALATATVQAMGLAPVSHFEGGFGAWREAGGQVTERSRDPG